MRSRFASVITASIISLATVASLPTPAQAATASCSNTATVSAGVPDVLGNTVIGNPVTLNVPLIGTPELFTGPSCNFMSDLSSTMEAKLSVTSTAGLVAGQMVVDVFSAIGSHQLKLTCGPALGSCEASMPVFAAGLGSAHARCAVSGVVGALTSVSCSLKPATI